MMARNFILTFSLVLLAIAGVRGSPQGCGCGCRPPCQPQQACGCRPMCQPSAPPRCAPMVPIMLDNCGPNPCPLPPINAPPIQTGLVNKPPVALPACIPPPKTIENTCHCVKTVVKPQVVQQLITVPTIQRYIQTTHTPVVEQIHYHGVPINCPPYTPDPVSPASAPAAPAPCMQAAAPCAQAAPCMPTAPACMPTAAAVPCMQAAPAPCMPAAPKPMSLSPCLALTAARPSLPNWMLAALAPSLQSCMPPAAPAPQLLSLCMPPSAPALGCSTCLPKKCLSKPPCPPLSSCLPSILPLLPPPLLNLLAKLL